MQAATFASVSFPAQLIQCWTACPLACIKSFNALSLNVELVLGVWKNYKCYTYQLPTILSKKSVSELSNQLIFLEKLSKIVITKKYLNWKNALISCLGKKMSFKKVYTPSWCTIDQIDSAFFWPVWKNATVASNQNWQRKSLWGEEVFGRVKVARHSSNFVLWTRILQFWLCCFSTWL